MPSILSLFKKTESKDEYYYKNEGEIVLGVNLHCDACVTDVLKALRGFDGVEDVLPNMNKNQVVVKGAACDPDKIASRLRRKLDKSVEIISPVPIKKKVTETVLKMYLHCPGCAENVEHHFLTMKGVESANAVMGSSTVTVKGTVDPKDLKDYIYKKTGKTAEVVIPKKQKDQNQNQNDGKKKDGEKKEEKDSKKKEKNDSEQKDWRTTGLSNDPRGFDYATEMFSDENTEGCSIM